MVVPFVPIAAGSGANTTVNVPSGLGVTDENGTVGSIPAMPVQSAGAPGT